MTQRSPGPGRLRRVLFNSTGLRAGWRLCIFILLVVVPIRVSTLVTCWALRDADRVTLYLLGGVVDFLVLLLATRIMGRIEGRTLAEYGLPWRQAFRGRFWQGTLVGFGCISCVLAFLRFAGAFHYGTIALHGAEILTWAVGYALVFSLVALLEEFGTRGYLLFTLSNGIGFWPAAALSTALFAYLHRGNPGENWLGLVNVGLFGLLACLLLRRSGTLWMPIGFHMAFDWGETFFYGVANSGVSYPGHLLTSSASGPAWLSGGSVGPEGSLPYTAILLLTWGLCARWLPHIRYPRSARPGSSEGSAGGGGSTAEVPTGL